MPDPLPPFGEYVPAVRSGRQLWVGGHFGTRPDGTIYTGNAEIIAHYGTEEQKAEYLMPLLNGEMFSSY
ncbi:MAG: acyl-CoA dehydrogenase family protein, partial [Actinomycetota bacterium]